MLESQARMYVYTPVVRVFFYFFSCFLQHALCSPCLQHSTAQTPDEHALRMDPRSSIRVSRRSRQLLPRLNNHSDGHSPTVRRACTTQVMKREREASQAIGKDYAARPVSYKGSLSLKLDRYTQRRKSPERPERGPERGSDRGGDRRVERRPEPSPPRRKAPTLSAEEIRRQQELKSRYGDASASKR